MSIFGRGVSSNITKNYNILKEDHNGGFCYQVLLTRPDSNKIPITNKLCATEREALYNLTTSANNYIERDPKDFESLIIKDPIFLNKYIYICELEYPDSLNKSYTYILNVEKLLVKDALSKYNIFFRIRLKNNIQQANKNRIINLAHNSMKISLKSTEFTKRCIEYTYRNNRINYDRFIAGVDTNLIFATYNLYIGIPNPKTNKEKVDQFYKEINNAIDSANYDLIRMGCELVMSGGWDAGVITLRGLSSIYGESSIILEAPDEEEDGVQINTGEETPEEDTSEDDYRIATDPEEDDKEEESTEESEEEPADNPEEGDDDYRIPDEGEETPTEESEEEPADNPEEGEGSAGDEGGEGENLDLSNDEDGEEDDTYKVNTGDEGGEKPSETPDQTEENVEGGEGSDSGNELKNMENEIFDDMDPEQRRIQDEELKGNYIKLYNTISDIVTRVDKITSIGSNISPISFIQSQLNDLKDYVYKYLTSVYSTKTYIENNINYEQYLLVLSGINDLLKQLDTKSSDIE